jgi:alkylhydroperoxidase family enzyme
MYYLNGLERIKILPALATVLGLAKSSEAPMHTRTAVAVISPLLISHRHRARPSNPLRRLDDLAIVTVEIEAWQSGADMTLTAPRIPPVPQAEWTPEMRELFAIMEGPAAYEKGSQFNVMLTLANHPQIATPFMHYYKILSSNSTLSVRLREIVTLRVAWRLQSEYEWTQHVAFGKSAGLGDEHIEALKQGSESPLWSNLERNALRAVDQLGTRSQIDDATWNGLSQQLTRKELMELLFIIGTYTLLCCAFNAMGVELERR